MANDRTTLRTRARIRADQDQADFPSDVAYNYYLDEGKKETWLDLLKAGWQVDYSSQTITATGAASYVVGSGAAVFTVLSVYRVDGQNRYQMSRLDPSFKAEVLSATSNQYAAYYELMISPTQGLLIRLYPSPTGGNYQVDYIPETPGFANDADVWYGPVGSDELLVLRAAIKGVLKEGRVQDAQAMESEYQRILGKVIEGASWLDQRNPARIRDVNRNAVRDPFAYNALGPDGTNW